MKKHHPGPVLFGIILSVAAFATATSIVPPLATEIAEKTGADSSLDFGKVYMLQFFCFAVASAVGGTIAHRYGLAERTLVLLGLLTVGATLVAGAYVPNVRWFVAWAVPLGFAGGIIETFGSIMVARMARRDSSKMLNFAHIAFALGAAVAPFGVSLLLAHEVTWTAAFTGFGVLILAASVAFVVSTRHFENVAHHADNPVNGTGDGSRNAPLLKDGLFVLLGIALFFYVFVEISTASWCPTYFQKHLGLSEASAAWRLSIFWAGTALGRALITMIPRRFTIWPALLTAASGILAVNVLLSFRAGPGAATVMIFASGLAAGPMWPVIVNCGQSLRQCARFTAGVIAAGGLGATFGPWLCSLVIERWGWGYLFPFLALCSAALCLAVLLARRRSARESQ